jgi:hypothetical protein
MRSLSRVVLPFLIVAAARGDGEPYATAVVSYTPGAGVSASYRNPNAALGEPSRMTGSANFPETVTPFQPPWQPGQVVSIGPGGSLVLELGQPAVDSPDNPYGIDLIVFSNALFTDDSGGAGVVGYCAGEGGLIDVSDDGTHWHEVPGALADGPMPTMGFMDAGPFDTLAGQAPTDFRKPMNPALTVADLQGLPYEDLVRAYDGSAGGVGVDLASVGLAQARFVRIRQPLGANSTPEVDAVVVVRPVVWGDLDGNGFVDAADLGLLLLSFGPCEGCAADLDGSGEVDAADLGILLLLFQ